MFRAKAISRKGSVNRSKFGLLFGLSASTHSEFGLLRIIDLNLAFVPTDEDKTYRKDGLCMPLYCQKFNC